MCIRDRPSGWPAAGFEVQIENTHEGVSACTERKKTGSLYGVRNVYQALVANNEWFQMNILVRGKQVQIRVNNMLVVDYIEPDLPFRADLNFQRVINHGTFALQGHDPASMRIHSRSRTVRSSLMATDRTCSMWVPSTTPISKTSS